LKIFGVPGRQLRGVLTGSRQRGKTSIGRRKHEPDKQGSQDLVQPERVKRACKAAPRRRNFTARIHCIYLTYPQREKRARDAIVTRISLSLRP
jgi:hypothetical protein